MSLLKNVYLHNEAKNLKQLFVRRYSIAILLIAILSTSAFLILKLALHSSDSTAYIVNISGNQRMLSQRIASFSQQYHNLKNDEIKKQLQTLIDEMRNANIALSTGEFKNRDKVEISNEISEIYYGETNLRKRVEQYLEIAQNILNSQNQEDSKPLLDEFLKISNGLLTTLNEAVLQYQKEGEEKISLIQSLEMIALIITIFTLLLEVIFIFQPMANKIFHLFKEIECMKRNLENEVKKRTLELEKTNEKLNYLASHDPLTGVKNRLNLEIELNELIEKYKNENIEFCVAIFDIDWFKKVNDTYGHDTGDFVLKELTNIFKDCIKEQDNVYRTGGEEFVVVIADIDYKSAQYKIDSIRNKVEKYIFNFKGIELTLTISAGFYHPSIIRVDDVTTILKLSDNALYRAKQTGRNKVLPVVI